MSEQMVSFLGKARPYKELFRTSGYIKLKIRMIKNKAFAVTVTELKREKLK